jgi:RND family efflux transporter MFP subunit
MIKRFISNYKYSIPLLVLIIVGGIFFVSRGTGDAQVESIIVQKRNVTQEVSVTGRVTPAEHVELAVQSGGKVSSISVKVGQSVKTGETLLRVDDADLRIRLGRQQAALAKTRLALTKQEPGTESATDDLKKAYEDGFNIISNTSLDVSSAMIDLDNILNDATHSPHLENENLRSISYDTIEQKLALIKSYSQIRDTYNALVLKQKTFTRNASPEALESMLNETYEVSRVVADVLKGVRNLIDFVEDRYTNPSTRFPEIDTDQAALTTHTTNINANVAALLASRNAIKNTRNSITSESSDTRSSQIDIQQAELDIQDTLVQINSRTIKSPVDGVVTRVDAKTGEIISANTPVISVISLNQFEIEASVPEADMAKLKPGQDAEIVLDAYGSDVVFKAKVISIDPAEIIIDGVATYKTTFQFVDTDGRIKSGMTASLTVKGETREGVVAIPQRSVITKNNGKYVRVVEGENTVEKAVTTGLRGSDGSIEITSGLSEGDQVVVFSELR